MPSCSTSRSVQKYKSSSSLTLQDVTDNGSKTSNKIELENATRTIESSSNIFVSSGHFFIGDGGLLSNVQMGGSAVGTLQTVTDNGSGSTHKINLTNIATSLETVGNIIAGTNVYASEFYGDGTTLTGIALSSDLTSNASRIGTLETDLTSNASRIGTLETDLTSNASRIGTLETDLTSNASRIGTLETDLTSNVGRISTLEGETQPVNRGGTGLGGCNTGDIIYGSATNTMSILSNSAATAGQFLRLNANKTAPEWATVSGGTGPSPWTTAVNDIYWNGSGNVGISNTNPQHSLSITGNTHSTYFHGDGSNVTNITLTKESSRNIEIAQIKALAPNWQRN
jgi:hypothetical protein